MRPTWPLAAAVLLAVLVPAVAGGLLRAGLPLAMPGELAGAAVGGHAMLLLAVPVSALCVVAAWSAVDAAPGSALFWLALAALALLLFVATMLWSARSAAAAGRPRPGR